MGFGDLECLLEGRHAGRAVPDPRADLQAVAVEPARQKTTDSALRAEGK